MKVRIKFSKEGCMKYIGHLDTMRYFQKAIRRAGLPIAFTGGFSPHMILSFAAPLGVGITSSGEYFDMELTEELPTAQIRERLDQVMAEGVRVRSARKVPEGKAGNAMALMAAADYRVQFREGRTPDVPWQERILEFAAQDSIPVWKKTKKSEREVDIRPFIYDLHLEGDTICMRLASASSNYTKPELVMDTFLKWMGLELDPLLYLVHREEIYTIREEENRPVFLSLEELGEEVE